MSWSKRISGATGGGGTGVTRTATFSVVLDSEPTADVSIGLSSDDLTEGTVSAASVTFTSANWDSPPTITVTGVNDDIDDGDITYHIVTAPASSGDSNYDLMNAGNVTVINTDNDVAGVNVSLISNRTTEAGVTATFAINPCAASTPT